MYISVQFGHSVVSDSLWPMDCSMPGLPVHHQLLEFTQTRVCWVGDAIQPSHPLSSPSPPTFNLSQHQGLFKWVSSLHQVAKVLEFHLQHQSFQWIFIYIYIVSNSYNIYIIFMYIHSYIYTHTHTYIRTYIYIYTLRMFCGERWEMYHVLCQYGHI